MVYSLWMHIEIKISAIAEIISVGQSPSQEVSKS